MSRKGMGVLIAVGLVAAMLLAQSPVVQGQRAGGGMGGGRGMAMGDIAAGKGSIYVINGDELQKLNANLDVAGTVQLQVPEAMQGGEGMRPGMAGRMARLAADEAGVYLLLGGKLTVYNHDLKEVKSKEIATTP